VKPIQPEKLLRDVGRRIAEQRSAKDWTQQELADRLGVTLRYVQSVEAGTQNLTLRSLASYCSVLGVPVGELFTPPQGRRPRAGRPRRGRP
jgi:transcriptional regulator with XRE-family HTH domain